MRTRIKFCGCTSARDADSAIALGVDAVGVIFAPDSPRYVSVHTAREIARAIPALVSLVGVFVEPPAALVEAALAVGYVPQFSGNESAQSCEAVAAGPYVKVFHLAPVTTVEIPSEEFERAASSYIHATWMFDSVVDGKYGGTGRTFDWNVARALGARRRIIISGGLTPGNVGACVRQLRPYGVDVRSGIETNGVKDPDKMRAFVRAVKEADAQT